MGSEKLSSAKVRNAKPDKRSVLINDSKNLYLQVSAGPKGNIRRSWIFRFKLPGGKTRDAGLGSTDDVGAAEARETARTYRNLVRQGIDPITHRDAEVAANLAKSVSAMSFDQAAEIYLRQHRAAWKSDVHAKQWESTIATYVSPIIGKLSVADLATSHVMRVLEPIWADKPVTASRVRGRIESVLGWAAASGFRKGKNGEELPNPARWGNHLDQLLATPTKLKKVKPQTSLPYKEMPALMQELQAREGTAALALRFTALTAVRSHDVRHARIADIDLENRVWTIKEFSKVGGEHLVPLSDAAIAVINQVRKTDSPFLFPNEGGRAMLSNTMLLALNELRSEATVHGFRSAFRTFAQERTTVAREVAESALGHAVGSKVERAYARSDLFEKRADLMQVWSRFLTEPAADNVVKLTRKA
jgi:integrase